MHPIEKLPPKPYVPFTAARKEKYLELLRHDPRIGGRVFLCAEAVGVSTNTIYDHCKRDPEFKARFEEARNGWIEEYAMTALLKRGIEGVERPIVGGRNKDEIVAFEKVFSDSLLLAYMRAYKPEFREKPDPTTLITGGTAGVMILPAPPQNIEHWQQAFGELAQASEAEGQK